MKTFAMFLAAIVLTATAGCETKKAPPPVDTKKGLEVDAGNVDLKVDEEGIEIKTPNADVDVDVDIAPPAADDKKDG